MITMSNFSKNGRLANQLFQYAAMIGFSESYGAPFYLPEWKYAKCFKEEFPAQNLNGFTKVAEPEFHFTPEYFKQFDFKNGNYDLTGYFQSRLYWKNSTLKVKQALTFTEDFKKTVRTKYAKLFEKPTIAMHIRRGDYVGNDYYYQLPITYFILALFKIENWDDKNILVFSDEPKYANFHFGCLPNVTVIEGNSDIFDLCLGSMCNDFVLSNSSYSWWMAKLAVWNDIAGEIIYPKHYFASPKKMDDYWPVTWTEFDHENKKINLKSVTFMIPAQYDHPDRLQNINLSVRFLMQHFYCDISINENISSKFNHLVGNYTKTSLPHFHRTKFLNKMAVESKTPIIVNWDADVFCAPMQIYLAYIMMYQGYDVAYPFDGRFAKVKRHPNYETLEKKNDLGILAGVNFPGMGKDDIVSLGGAVFYNKKSFLEAGGENENFVSWGQEDGERFTRFNKLGYKIGRVPGALYHLEHWRGPNSTYKHPFAAQNKQEYEKISNMTKEQLVEYIKTWKK